MKKELIGAIIVVISAFGAANVVLAQIAPWADYSISVTGVNGTVYTVGQPWTLQIKSNLPNQNFSLCAIDNNGRQSCTAWGVTDNTGSWTGSGNFPSSTIGSWIEWASFSLLSQTFISNRITFTVNPANACTTSRCSSNWKWCHAYDITYSDAPTCKNVSGASYYYDSSCGGDCNGTGCPSGDGSLLGGRCPNPNPTSVNPTGGSLCSASSISDLASALTTLENFSGVLQAGNVPPDVLITINNTIVTIAKRLAAAQICLATLHNVPTTNIPSSTSQMPAICAATGQSHDQDMTNVAKALQNLRTHFGVALPAGDFASLGYTCIFTTDYGIQRKYSVYDAAASIMYEWNDTQYTNEPYTSYAVQPGITSFIPSWTVSSADAVDKFMSDGGLAFLDGVLAKESTVGLYVLLVDNTSQPVWQVSIQTWGGPQNMPGASFIKSYNATTGKLCSPYPTCSPN